MKKEFVALLCFSVCTSAYADWSGMWDDLQSLAKKTSESIREELETQGDRLLKLWGDADEDSALVGRFYDLKQPLVREDNPKPEKDGKQLKNMRVEKKKGAAAKPLRHDEVSALIGEFARGGWDPAVLERYYSPNVELYAPYFYLPRCRASYGPCAFDCEDTVEPTAWVAHYRGVVTAPKSGKFRFVGTADDTMLVRFNKKLVLEAGWSIPTKSDYMYYGTTRSYQDEIAKRVALYQYDTTSHWNRSLGGIASGEVFEVKEGKQYPIEILVSEIPGNEFGFCLLLEELPKSSGKVRRGYIPPSESPIFHIFRTNDSLPNRDAIEDALQVNGEDHRIPGMECPPFLADSLIWRVDKKSKENDGFLKRVERTLSGKKTAMGVRRRAEKKEENN